MRRQYLLLCCRVVRAQPVSQRGRGRRWQAVVQFPAGTTGAEQAPLLRSGGKGAGAAPPPGAGVTRAAPGPGAGGAGEAASAGAGGAGEAVPSGAGLGGAGLQKVTGVSA